MRTVLNDLRFALRQLRRSPGFAIAAMLTLALGIGANTAIFSLLDQALLRSLPVRNPQQMVFLQGTGKSWEGRSSTHGGSVEAYFSYPMYQDLAKEHRGFEGLLATAPADVDIARGNLSQLASAELVSGNYFDVLQLTPALGRTFHAREDTPGKPNEVAVVSFDYWRTHMNSDPSVVGSTLSVNNYPFVILGVAPAGFRSAVWGETPALFVPMSNLEEVVPGSGKRLTRHTDRWLNILGRLAPGTSAASAQAANAPLWHALRSEELKTLGTRSQHFIDDFVTNSRLLVQPAARGFSYQRETYEAPLIAVMAMAALVLLIASVNVASLLLVRAAGRVREFSLRTALGALRSRVVQQLLLEGLLIGVGGGVLGLLLSPLAIHALLRHPGDTDGTGAFTAPLAVRVLVFNFTIALAVSVLFSLTPALQLGRADITEAMRAPTSANTGRKLRFRSAVVSLQIGLSVLLLVAAGLFVRTLEQLRNVRLGYATDHLVTFGLEPRLAGYTPQTLPALRQRMLETLGALPGVESVAANNSRELGGSSHGGNVQFATYHPGPEEDVDVDKTNVSPEFFPTLGVPLLAGRELNGTDDAAHPKVAVVNERLARRYFGNARAAVGQRLMDGASNKPDYDIEIVGVVADSLHAGVRKEIDPTVYQPLEQSTDFDTTRELYFYLRTRLPPADLFASVRQAVSGVNGLLAIDDIRTMEEQIDSRLRNERMIELLAVSFGVLATLLAGIGLYGVLAYSTAQRTREIGIRMALGSTRAAVTRAVLVDVLRLGGWGVLLALPLTFALGRLLRDQLYGVSAADPKTLGGAVLLIGVTGLLAGLLPARKAAAVNPSEALRSE